MFSNTAIVVALFFATQATCFPFVNSLPGVNPVDVSSRSIMNSRRNLNDCPFQPSYKPAAPMTAKYPYLGAVNGTPGTGKGGIPVPAPGDVAHYYQAPGPTDVRGPCPGLNTLANHGFIARSGIVSYTDLVDAQQNVYNVEYTLANTLAILGVGLDGDIIGTGLLSIGCGANARTAEPGNILADELGLNAHDQFEGDASLTRNDYFLANGDDYTFNSTLFTEMMKYCNGNCNLPALAKFRYQRYQESVAENGNFFFGPGSLLLYAAATFLYELFAAGGTADPKTMMSFFGAKQTSPGQYAFNGGERIPPGFKNRVTPYDGTAVGEQTLLMYSMYPVQFGGNAGQNNFNVANASKTINNGYFNGTSSNDVMCLIYQSFTMGFPEEVTGVINIPTDIINAMIAKLQPMASSSGCPLDYVES